MFHLCVPYSEKCMKRKASIAAVSQPKSFLDGWKKGDPITPEMKYNFQKLGALYLMQMNRIQEPFIRAKNSYGRTPKRRFLETGEKAGKTMIGLAEDIAHAMGFRPWLAKDDPDFKINIRVPNQGLIGCMTMEQSVDQKIKPELERLIPAHCQAEFKNNQQGHLKEVTIPYDYFGNPCGSTISIRSYNQMAETYLGIDNDFYHWDEPPPSDVLTAAERGKVITNAPSWFTMTPLSQPYIYDKFAIRAFNNGGDDQEIAVFKGRIWDNCQDWCKDCDCTIEENQPENFPVGQLRPVNVCPKCGMIMGFAPRAGIDEYLKTLDADERDARENGNWAHLSGLVYKELDREVHQYEDHEIPEDWMKVECVDPHDARPTRWLFGAVSPEDIIINGKAANRVYWFSYLLANGNIDEIARKVKVKRAEYGYREAKLVILDAKFGAKTVKTGADETTWEEELRKAGINNIVLSQSAPGNIALGHKRVKEYLKPHYSVVKDKEVPGMLFAREGCKGARSPWQDMSNYQWKTGTDKPEEAYKDFADTVRYFALEQPIYKRPEKDMDMRMVKAILEMHSAEQTKYNPLTYGLMVQ